MYSGALSYIYYPLILLYFRKVTNYTNIADTSAEVLDGIDIQVSKLLGRLLNQRVSYHHCWWSWGEYIQEEERWVGAVGKVLYDEADIAVNSLDIRLDRSVSKQ